MTGVEAGVAMEMLRAASHLGAKRSEEVREQGGVRVRPGVGRAPIPAYLGQWVSLDEELSVLKLGRSQESPEGVGHPPWRSLIYS